MRHQRATWSVLAALVLSCNAGGDVEHAGAYGFLPRTRGPATASLPLRTLLVIEEDGAGHQLFYAFEGDLGAAALGVDSLDQIEARHSRYALRFDYPLQRYAEPDSSSGGAPGEPPEGDVGSIRYGEHEVQLIPVDSSTLAPLGVSRFVTALTGSSYAIRAFFGAADAAADIDALVLTLPTRERHHASELSGAADIVVDDGEALGIAWEESMGTDYVTIDLVQATVRIADDAPLEAILRVTLRPDTPLNVTDAALSSAFASLCWSMDAPLYARVTRVARHYAAHPHGDFAVIHHRAELVEVPSETWHPRVTPPEPPAYCSLYD